MNELLIVALGPHQKEKLTLEVAEALRSSEVVLLRTKRHGAARWMDENHIPYESFDELHECAQDFDAFAADIAKTLYPDQQVYLTLTDVQREILASVAFIQFTLRARGEHVRAMDESAVQFIAGWESEAYRKSILK